MTVFSEMGKGGGDFDKRFVIEGKFVKEMILSSNTKLYNYGFTRIPFLNSYELSLAHI